MGWILFLMGDENDRPTPCAWPDATTRITVQGDGYRLASGGGGGASVAVIDTEEIEHTNDFQQVQMWLHPEDEEEGEDGPAEEGEEP
jgi:hypothetical protein